MRPILALGLFFLSLTVHAQTNSYVTDLSALHSTIQKTASYKDQIRGEKLTEYKVLYNRLVADSLVTAGDYRYFYNLAQLIFPLRDNHLGFYQYPDTQKFKDKEAIEQYILSKEFSAYPSLKIDTDSLKTVLAAKPLDSLEGIYHYDKYYSVGLFKTGDAAYTGVVVDSEIGLWAKGQIAFHLYQFGPNLYKAIYSHPITKNYILEGSEKSRNRSLVNSYFYGSFSQSVYSKELQSTDHVNLPAGGPSFAFQHIDNDVQYLLVRTFQNNYRDSKRSKDFFDSVKNVLTAGNLILDLRNNAGGAESQMKKYLDLMKAYTKKGKVYVLLNNGTLSQAEIFTLALKKLDNIITVGQTTKGMLAYGSNSDKRVRLPGQQFEIYITDMTNPAYLLQYEDVGINPDVFLNGNSDWIEQVMEIIKKK